VLIDWFTVGAQAVNFAILAWLLKRLLYRPILDAIDARENRVARELADADAAKAMAEREREEFDRRNREFEAQRAEHMARAIQEARSEGQRLLEQGRRAADDYAARRRDANAHPRLEWSAPPGARTGVPGAPHLTGDPAHPIIFSSRLE